MSLADLFKTVPQPEILQNSFQEHPAAVPIVPSFDQVILEYGSGGGPDVNISSIMYPSAATAEAIRARFGAAVVIQVPVLGTAAWQFRYADKALPAQVTTPVLLFLPGTIFRDASGAVIGSLAGELRLGAGALADIFRRAPEAEFPGYSVKSGMPPVTHTALSVPEQQCWDLIRREAERAGVLEKVGA